MKKQKSTNESVFNNNNNNNNNHFDYLSEEIVFAILDGLDENPIDNKSFSLVCKLFYAIESRHRKILKPLRSEHLTKVLNRYPNVTRLNLSLCPRITDTSLSIISTACNETLRSIDLSRSKFFSHLGLSNLVTNCSNLIEIDLSNATELRDSAAAAIAEAKNLEKLWLGRCKSITDIGIGCIAVGCRKLRLINLKWCLGVGDLGVGLIAVKCKEIRSLDLLLAVMVLIQFIPCFMITKKCLSSILKLQYLEDLVLEGCFGIDDGSLAVLKQGCKSLETLDMSSCQNVSHVGLSSLTSGTGCLRQLILAYGSPVTLALADSLQKLSTLQSIKLDGCLVTCSGLKAIGNWYVSLRELSLSKCTGVTDKGLSSLVTKHKDLRKLDITCCRKITHVSIAHITNSCTSLTSLKMESCTLVPKEAFVLIGQRCHFLEELDLTDNEIDDEEGIKDTGIQAIARGCPGLEMINLAYCKDISDSSLLSLSKCWKLNALETAIATGCKQLTKLDIKKCYTVNDAGMIPLSHFSQNLKQINLSYSSVTDVGLLSLASISCLQSMTILHLKGLTQKDSQLRLLACGGLTKVKLQASFKSLLPPPLFEHLEARGCSFQWRDKLFQAELDDSRCWKLQLEDIRLL
ncbi:F-box/LRR-repeat protein 3 [Camellia lanceoleosa]|uniref:F-box/LRR-repeat protein 3 n=1 Tax=Camellia lanceoleosa TaxID=1840588 RepID=A0ACC0GD76_9ERIC|nr:F-box/LRR-repeat protein 3 [Camellia lanceoleosa]